MWTVALFGFAAWLSAAVQLPPRIAKTLDQKYRGWKLAPPADQIALWFEQYRLAYQPNIARGDFNIDGEPDYAVQIIVGGKQRVVAFVSNGAKAGYSMHALAEEPADPFTFLIIYKKGEKDFDFETMKPFRYAADALGVLYLRKTALTFTWEGKKFRKREAPGDEEVEAAREAK